MYLSKKLYILYIIYIMTEKKNNYIDLQNINGRLFPSWILANFRKYKLPEIVKQEGVDPCKLVHDGKKELTRYQAFLGALLDYRSPYRDMLVYHLPGAGKTAAAINIYNVLYNANPNWNVFLLIKASLKEDPWMKELRDWLLNKKDGSERFANIKWIHYDSPFAERDFLDAKRTADSSKKNMYIIEEAHNFIKNVYNNIATGKGQRASIIYNYIQTEKREDDSTRIILMSGTPAVNNPYELALMYNLMRPDIFPKDELKFNELYIGSIGTYEVLKPERENLFMRRILGLTSYYIGATPDTFADKKNIEKNLVMDKYHQEVYEYYEYIEDQMKKSQLQSRKKQQSSTYQAYTRQACNFVFPPISDEINGETRPRPGKFKLTETDMKLVDEGKGKKIESEKSKDVDEYTKVINKFLSSLIGYWDKKNDQDIKKGRTLKDDVNIFMDKYKFKFNKFWREEKNKSSLLESMYACSAKMTAICFYIFRSPGPVLIYSNYVKMEGLEIFKIYLSYLGYSDYNDTKGGKDYFRYTEFHGGIERDQREKNRQVFNDIKNKDGKIIKIFLDSPAGTEGITLESVRQVHVMEPYWNETRIEQLIARAVRRCSHKNLPIEERNVEVFRYKVVRANGKTTTDQLMENIAKSKETLIQSFLTAVRKSAVDCELFKSANMMKDEYQCFKFDEPSLFDKTVGPAYKHDIYYDMKLENGLNSNRSNLKKIRVIKINAVIQYPDRTYSEKQQYWYSNETGVVYDYELDFPVGKVLLDSNGIPNKLDKDTFIISITIDIPMLSNM
jgi:hypothetical protein